MAVTQPPTDQTRHTSRVRAPEPKRAKRLSRDATQQPSSRNGDRSERTREQRQALQRLRRTGRRLLAHRWLLDDVGVSADPMCGVHEDLPARQGPQEARGDHRRHPTVHDVWRRVHRHEDRVNSVPGTRQHLDGKAGSDQSESRSGGFVMIDHASRVPPPSLRGEAQPTLGFAGGLPFGFQPPLPPGGRPAARSGRLSALGARTPTGGPGWVRLRVCFVCARGWPACRVGVGRGGARCARCVWGGRPLVRSRDAPPSCGSRPSRDD